MILPFIREFEIKKDIKEDIKDNILSKEEIQQEADSLNVPVDNTLEKSLLHKREEIQKQTSEMESLKWKRADKGK